MSSLMSRSVKDLRELICVSRLSYREEEGRDELGSSNSDEDFNVPQQHVSAPKLPKRKTKELSPLEKEEKLVSPPLSAGSSGRGSPLPPIRKSSATSPDGSGRSSPVNCSENGQGLSVRRRKIKPARTNFDSILLYMDSTVISDWLRRANDAVKDLTSWLHAGANFVHFAHFFMSEIPSSKRRELVQMEFGIVLEEVNFSLKAGIDSREVTLQDLDSFMSAVLWEYPRKFCDSERGKFFLGILVCLCSGRKENYKTLLSNVRCSTTNKQFVQLILATRSFAVVSLCAGVINFYKQVSGRKSCASASSKDSLFSKDIVDVVMDFAFQAVHQGLADVLEYLLQSFELDPCSVKGKDGKSLLFSAVISTQEEVLRFLLKVTNRKLMLSIRPSP